LIAHSRADTSPLDYLSLPAPFNAPLQCLRVNETKQKKNEKETKVKKLLKTEKYLVENKGGFKQSAILAVWRALTTCCHLLNDKTGNSPSRRNNYY